MLARTWLHKIPSGWAILPIRYVLATPIADGPHETPTFLKEGVPFLSVDAIKDGELDFRSCRFISPEEHFRFSRKTLPRRNDILMGKAASTGKIARVKTDREFNIWSPLALIRVAPPFLSSYIEYALKSNASQAQIDVLCTSNTQKNISMADIPRIVIAAPSPGTQESIAAYLNRKTAAIDALIEKKERLIQLLQEKRQALITQAVTKGLNPNVPMKDSGVEWIGEIPKHWSMIPLKHLSEFTTSGPRGWSSFYSDEGPLFLRIANLDRGSVDLDMRILQRVSPPPGAEGVRTRVMSGDILISITADIGSVGIVPDGLGEAYISQHIALTRPLQKRCSARWIAHCAASHGLRTALQELKQGGTKVGLGLDDIRELRMPTPPPEEQSKIAEFVDESERKSRDTESALANQRTLLQEYRQALITAAVTGQIDIPAEEPAAT